MTQIGRFQHTQPSLSLRWVLVVPFVLQLLGTVGLVGYLSYKNGQKAVVTMVHQVMEEVSERIDDRLDYSLHVPSNAVAANRLAVEHGSLDPNNAEQIRRSLWQQMLLEPEMVGTHFVDENGVYIGYERIVSADIQQKAKALIGETLPLGTILWGEAKADDPSVQRFYLADAKGQRGRLLLVNQANTQPLPGYQDAKAAGPQTWSSIHPLQGVPVLGIGSASAVYSASGQFEGVFTSDFQLSDIHTFLNQLQFSPTGQTFILDRSGALVASSTAKVLETPAPETPVLETPAPETPETSRPGLPNPELRPMQAIASPDLRTRVITQRLLEQFGDFKAIQTPQQITVVVEQQRQFVRITPCRNAHGLDWLVVAVVPEADFMAKIHRNTQTTLWLCAAALGGAIAVGLFTAKQVTQRITQISLASQAMANNNFDQSLSTQSGVRELNELADSFNQMAARVQHSFTVIQNTLSESEEKFTTIFRTSPDPLAITTLDECRIVEANEQLLECFGYSREELIGKTSPELNLWPNPELQHHFQQQIAAAGRIYNQEVEMRAKSGVIKTLLVSAELCHLDGQGHVIVTFKDISDRKQVERSLRASEAHQRALISALPDLVMRTSRDGYYLEFAATGDFHLIGDLPTLVGTHIRDSLPPITAQQRLAAIEAALETQSIQIYEQNLSIDGATQIEEVRVVPYGADEALVLVRDISDRKQAELALQHSEERYRSIIEDQTELIARFLPDSTLMFVNQAYCRYFGINYDDYIGKSYRLLVCEDDHAYVTEQLQSISIDTPTITIENRVVADGQIRWMQWANRGLFDSLGNVVEYQSVGRDITDRKRAELALSQSEARLQAFLRNAPTVIFEKDLEGRYVFGNREFEKVIQLPWAEVLGKTDLEVLPPHVAEVFRANDRRALAAGQPIYIEEYSELPDGLHTYAANKFPLLDETGQAYGLAGISIDITARKQAEQALQASEERFREIANTIPQMFFVRSVDPDQYLYVSPSCETIWGRSQAEFLTTPWIWLDWIHPEDLEYVQASIALQMQGIGVHRDYRIIRPNGEIRWISASISVIRDADGRPVRFVGLVDDISDRKQIELALKQESDRRRILFDTSIDGIVVGDLSGNVIEANASFAQMLGYSLAEVLTLNVADFDAQLSADELAQKVTATHSYAETFETRHRRKDGSIYDVEVSANSATWDGQEVRFCICRDISDRKQTEAALRNAYSELERYKNQLETTNRELHSALEELVTAQQDVHEQNAQLLLANEMANNERRRYQDLFDFAPDGYAVVSKTGLIQEANRALAILLEQTPSQLISKPFILYLAESDRPQFINIVTQFEQYSQSLPQPLECTLQTQTDTFVPVILTAAPSYSVNHKFLGTRLSIHNISDRKQAELALQESEARFQTLVTNMPGMIYRFFPDRGAAGAFTYVSSGAHALLGIEPEQILSDAQAVWSLIHPEDLPSLQSSVMTTTTNMTPWAWEGRLTTPSGQLKWVQGSSRPHQTPEGVCWDGLLLDISDRKQAEQALQQLNSDLEQRVQQRTRDLVAERLRLQLALDAANMGTWESTLETGIWSERTEAIFGYAPGTFSGDREAFLNLVYIDDQERVFAALNHCLATRSPYSIEYRINRLDGQLRWVAVKGMVVETEDGSGLRIVGVALDITEVKQNEMSLRDSEERLRLALVAANQGLYDLNVQTGETIVSPEYAIILGYDPATFHETNAKWIERLHPDDHAAVAEVYRAYVAGELPDYSVEFRQRTQSGEWKWILSVGKIVAWDADGQPLRMLGIHTDISDRKQAERDLQESRNMLKLVLDTIPQRVFWKDRESRFLGCNATFAGDYYLAVEDVIGKTDRELPWALWADLYRADDVQVINTGIPKLNYEEPTVDGQGKQIWIRSNKIPLTNTQGQVIGVIGCYDDITNFKHAQVALQQLNGELEQRVEERTADLQMAIEVAEAANQAKSLFLANMSHELRTPLNVILGFAQLLSNDPFLTAGQREYIRTMHRSGDHLLNLINDILDLSKIEAGRITLENNRIDLMNLMCDLREMFWERADQKHLLFNLDLAEDLPHCIVTDGNKLRQVLINLLSNAIKFTQQGSVCLRVSRQAAAPLPPSEPTSEPPAESSAELPAESSPEPPAESPVEPAAEPPAESSSEPVLPSLPSALPPALPSALPTTDYLVFAVEDTGVGIATKELVTIFDAFIQAEAGRTTLEGTGLGLTICRQLTQLMGGELTVSSSLGQGSTFRFAIPLCVAEPALDGAGLDKNPKVAVGLAPGQPSYRILVVDDQPDNCRLMMQLLTQIGLNARQATSGEEAIACWREWQPHLIWMDIRMPGIDGCETTRRIRAEAEAADSALSPDGVNVPNAADMPDVPNVPDVPNATNRAINRASADGDRLSARQSHQSTPFPFIIAATAQTSADERTRALAAGCDDFISKPIQINEILDKMSDYLGIRYRYQGETIRKPQLNFTPSSSSPLISADLQQMSAPWIAALRQSALYCDEEETARLIEQIPPEGAALREGLKRLLTNYKFEIIVQLTTE